jgi:cell division protein FtsZ
VPGLINVDFADVRSVMAGMGNALMGMGFGRGPDRARQAADMAICSPLLEDISIAGAQGLLVNFMGGEEMTLAEVDEASTLILDAAGPDANVIFGAVIDPNLTDEIRVTLIATGFGECARAAQKAPETRREPLRLAAEEPRATPTPLPAAPPIAERMVVGAGAEPTSQPAGFAPASTIGRTARVMLGSRPATSEYEDGVLGPARPLRRDAEPAVEPQAPAPTTATMPEPAPDEQPPDNIVPLVWKQNLNGARWSPKVSSRWQRVLRRDQSDVPSFMRRRQKD